MIEFKEFDRFQDLLIPYDFKKSNKFVNQLEKDAVKWYKEVFSAGFGRKSQYNEAEYNWYFAGGILFFGIKGLSDSEFAWQHVLMALHGIHWQKPALIEGHSFGVECRLKQTNIQGYHNPYSKNDSLDNKFFDIGKSWGIYGKELKF